MGRSKGIGGQIQPSNQDSIYSHVYFSACCGCIVDYMFYAPTLHMIDLLKWKWYLRRQYGSPFVFQFSITHTIGICTRYTYADPLRRLTYKTNLDSILRTLNDSKTSYVFPLCTLRSRKTKSVFCIPQCADIKNKVCFVTLQCAEHKNRSCFCTPQRAKLKNRLCFPTPQRAELPFRVCFYTPKTARQQLNKPLYSHSAYGPISTQTVFPSWRKKSSPHVSRRGSSILTVIKWCENFQVLN